MASPKPQPLESRIAAFRAEIDAAIDAHVAEIAKTCPGVPQGVIRNSLTRGFGCQCQAYVEIKAKDQAA